MRERTGGLYLDHWTASKPVLRNALYAKPARSVPYSRKLAYDKRFKSRSLASHPNGSRGKKASPSWRAGWRWMSWRQRLLQLSVLTMRPYLIFLFAALMASCKAYQSERVVFCDLEGNKVDGVFFDRELGTFTIKDVFFNGSFDCPPSRIFCFRGDPIYIEVPRDVRRDLRFVSRTIFGPLVWTYRVKTGKLRLQTAGANNASEIETCEPLKW